MKSARSIPVVGCSYKRYAGLTDDGGSPIVDC